MWSTTDVADLRARRVDASRVEPGPSPRAGRALRPDGGPPRFRFPGAGRRRRSPRLRRRRWAPGTADSRGDPRAATLGGRCSRPGPNETGACVERWPGQAQCRASPGGKRTARRSGGCITSSASTAVPTSATATNSSGEANAMSSPKASPVALPQSTRQHVSQRHAEQPSGERHHETLGGKGCVTPRRARARRYCAASRVRSRTAIVIALTSPTMLSATSSRGVTRAGGRRHGLGGGAGRLAELGGRRRRL